jgi:Na+-transporting methylmalonyl-CoA/oxaloacetate decarboxylase gamma subunit
VDRRSAYRNLRVGLLLGSLAIVTFGMSFVFAVLYIA